MAAKGRKGSSAIRTRSTYKPKPKATGKGKLENDLKKQDQKASSPDSPPRVSSSPTKGPGGFDFEESADGNPTAGGFSTPKAPKHRIPKIEPCPPAPKRQRVDALDDHSLTRRQITFFAPPELEVFFLLSHGGSVSG